MAIKVLYISGLSSKRILDYLYNTSQRKPMYSIQKFHRLLLEGLKHNHADVKVLSSIPVSPTHKKKLWHSITNIENGVEYKTIPFLNFSIIKQICIFIYAFLYTFTWGIKKTNEKRLICDVLNISICLGALSAAKLLGLKATGIVTDMPGLMVGVNNKSHIQKFITAINKSYLSSFDSYILLTEYMNPIINTKNKPYIIMEGLVDSEMELCQHDDFNTLAERVVIYAGGLYERYGVKMLLDAFMQTPFTNVRFDIYGSGDMSAVMNEYQKQDSRIHYYGVVPNDTIVEAELKSTLLINPRPTHEGFTKYSFPSKNMEYMVSGTPVLTTKLPGMPKEYYKYVFLFDNETVDGYKQTLTDVLSLSNKDLYLKGKSAKEFVLKNKNNIIQAKHVIELLQM